MLVYSKHPAVLVPLYASYNEAGLGPFLTYCSRHLAGRNSAGSVLQPPYAAGGRNNRGEHSPLAIGTAAQGVGVEPGA